MLCVPCSVAHRLCDAGTVYTYVNCHLDVHVHANVYGDCDCYRDRD